VCPDRQRPQGQYLWLGGDQPVLIADAFRHEGEPMAVVAAESEDAAWDAVQKIRYEIQEETPVFDMLEAVKPDAPKVRPEGNLHMWGNRPYRQIVFGDIEAGFKQADYIVEGEYHHSSAKHAQLEPHVSLAVPEASGKLTIHTCSQCLHFHLGALCGIFGLPMNKVHSSAARWVAGLAPRTTSTPTTSRDSSRSRQAARPGGAGRARKTLNTRATTARGTCGSRTA
jgi:CO/xanthine dehydrogenase Mo-binding subunit